MVAVGWVLLLAMIWLTLASIYEADPFRTAVGVTTSFLAWWALSLNRAALERASGANPEREGDRTPRD